MGPLRIEDKILRVLLKYALLIFGASNVFYFHENAEFLNGYIRATRPGAGYFREWVLLDRILEVGAKSGMK
jgi:hypothetical protein